MIEILLFRIEMSYQISRMDACIGPAGPGYRNCFATDGAQREFEGFLDTFRVRLDLPAMETGPIIRKFYKIALFQNSLFLIKNRNTAEKTV